MRVGLGALGWVHDGACGAGSVRVGWVIGCKSPI